MASVPPGISLREWIEQNEVVLDGGIRIQKLAPLAAAILTEQAEWLAHILTVLCPKEHYQFVATPDIMEPKRSNVCVLDTRLEEGKQLVGFARPAEEQPILKSYIEAMDP